MNPKVIHIPAEQVMPWEEASKLEGTFLTDSSYTILLQESATVFKPDGSPLLLFRKNVLPPALCKTAYHALRDAATKTDNRGNAAGTVTDTSTREALDGRRPGVILQTQGRKLRYHPIKNDGTVSNSNYAGKLVHSGVVGYYDRHVRFPFCRQTAYTAKHPERFLAAMPFIQAIDAQFASLAPERYVAQRAAADSTSPDFRIPNTAFTTLTVNKNFQTAVHCDAGDYRPGFGVMTTFSAGHYGGCYLVFPAYRIAVDVRTTDLLLSDVHEWHGNTKLEGIPGRYERVSIVLYYREHMQVCGTAEQELEQAKHRQPRQSLHEKAG